MKKKVLIVDDEPDIATSVKMLVDNAGYDSKIANNGQTALSTLKKEKFDLVLLDILMPVMSGRQVLETIRKDAKLKNQKVAFMTVVQLGQFGKDLIKSLKPVEYFQKPILDIEDFKLRLKKIIGD